MSKTFASMAVPNYRRYFAGTILANTGQWMSRTAQSWLVLVVLTDHNASALGWLMAAAFTPLLVITPWAGALADKYPKRRIMVLAQIVMCVDAAILATLVLTGTVRLWHVFTLVAMDGTATSFYNPAMQAFVSEIVPLSKLPNAISLNSASFNGARILGPGVAGLLIAGIGTGWVMVINVACFIGFITTLILLRADQLHPSPPVQGKSSVRDGVKYVRVRFDLKVLLAIGFVMGTFGFNFNLSDSLMATVGFGRGSGEYGLLGSIMGLGAIAAALGSARRKPRMRWVELALVVYTVGMGLSAIAPNYFLFALLKVPVGWGAVSTLIVANSMVQTSVSPQMRGRVMSLWSTLLLGGTPFVSPALGWIGDQWGPRWTVGIPAIIIGLLFIGVTATIMHNDSLKVRFDPHKKAPWLRIERGQVTVNYTQETR